MVECRIYFYFPFLFGGVLVTCVFQGWYWHKLCIWSFPYPVNLSCVFSYVTVKKCQSVYSLLMASPSLCMTSLFKGLSVELCFSGNHILDFLILYLIPLSSVLGKISLTFIILFFILSWNLCCFFGFVFFNLDVDLLIWGLSFLM